MRQHSQLPSNGFTLIEAAIFLVIIGLLLGFVLRGQELIAAARARNIAAQLTAVKIAYLGFYDRFRMLPGDMATPVANAVIPGGAVGCTGGTACGNGRIDADEVYVAWAQLSRAGFMSGTYTGSIADTGPSAANSPVNPYNGYLQLVTDNRYDDTSDPAQYPVLNIKTGSLIPSTVMTEVDRKIDDGAPLSGQIRSAGHTATTVYDGVLDCVVAAPPVAWNATADIRNCGGVEIL